MPKFKTISFFFFFDSVLPIQMFSMALKLDARCCPHGTVHAPGEARQA
jgi:hypothetical protein